MIEFLAFDELGDKHVVFGGLDELVELEEVGVVDPFEDLNLSADAAGVFLRGYSLLVEHFHSHWLTSRHVDGSLDLPESATADGSLKL